MRLLSRRRPFRVSTSFWSCGCLLATAAVTTAAAPQPTDPTPGASPLSVMGCLTRQPTDPGSTARAERFLLTLDQPAGAANADKQPRSGGATPAPPHRTVYVLRAAEGASVDFAGALNRKVSVVGTSTAPSTTAPLAGRSPEATPYQAPVATPSDASRATGTPFDTVNLPTLVVKSMTLERDACK